VTGAAASTRVLVVDDERGIRQALAINLRARGYEVGVSANGSQALADAAARPPDVVVLDLGLPDMDGGDVIRGLRGWTRAPIIVLSARSGQADKVDALRLTPTEWQVLEVLVRNEGRLVSQRQLLQEVWGPQYETETNYLRVYLGQLRRKLERDPAHPRHLITEPGMGYRFVRAEG
jgi:two-component system KDP operon response regulator KdpE